MEKECALAKWEESVRSTAKFDTVEYLAIGLAGETGEFCEEAKKSFRETGGFTLTEGRRENGKQELGDILYYVTRLAQKHGWSLADVMEVNHEKRAGRYLGDHLPAGTKYWLKEGGR